MRQARVLIVGCGSVGTMCAYALQKSGDAEVTAILRSNYDLVHARGFHIRSIDHGEIDSWRPHHMERSLEDTLKHGPFDFVLVAMKNLRDVYSIPNIIGPAITAQTSIILVQNGIDIERPFLEAFPANILLSGVPLIGCELNGREMLHNDSDILQLAYWPNPNFSDEDQSNACSTFAQMYNTGGAKCNVQKDISWFRWRKLIWNASFNTVCAITGLDSGAIQDAGGSDTLIRPAMRDVVAVAQAAGHVFPDEILDNMVAFTPKEARLKPGMQVDAVRQKPMEIEVILGNPIRTAKNLGVSVPTLVFLYALLQTKQWAFLNMGK
ncbi:ketopantoate reductase PanE/ApbA C terminal-domain-containing protein [Colletotrichum phormii]|uniref:2-dehydropantoate 2-reductase n=1 Tax=Colletotrichum phormii TaxID=359342 RepID=A0AAI9ZFB1_9PEZI|nr:ketopantoate reductase PanE/ApbA C terminal-domain-containing protein [Colletotrichum phormii]KAK1622401.1 ketopantoate reductase PanE/ApbA C terminal-domain-containing protein [Colletotrichum phormii]